MLVAEQWDPEHPDLGWQQLAEMTYGRAGHSTAVLLPDATVLSAGDDSSAGNNPEVFEPPYLSAGPRPIIGSAPAWVAYGDTFTVVLSDALTVPADQIDKVSLVRLAATTHGFDQNQRYVPLVFEVVDTDTLNVWAPPDANPGGPGPSGGPAMAPPGYYMLFLVSDAGVPSRASFLRLALPAGA